MSWFSIIRHPLYYKDLVDAYKALCKNWRTPDMKKLLQREFLLPPLSILAVAIAALMGYDLGPEQRVIVAGMCATALTGIILRKSILGPQAGLAKLREREFWLPVVGELIPFANQIFSLDMSVETQASLAAVIAGMVAALLGAKAAVKGRKVS
jgi:hypothetical protein